MDLYKHPLFQDRLEGATRVAVDILKDTHPGFRWNLNPDGSVSITRGHSKTVIRNEFEHNNNKVFSGFTLTRCVLRDGHWAIKNQETLSNTDPNTIHKMVNKAVQEVFV